MKPGRPIRTLTQEAVDGVIPEVKIAQDHNDWKELRFVQFLIGDQLTAEAEVGGREPDDRPDPASPDTDSRLSTIQEGSFEDSLDSFLLHTDSEWQATLATRRGP